MSICCVNDKGVLNTSHQLERHHQAELPFGNWSLHQMLQSGILQSSWRAAWIQHKAFDSIEVGWPFPLGLQSQI